MGLSLTLAVSLQRVGELVRLTLGNLEVNTGVSLLRRSFGGRAQPYFVLSFRPRDLVDVGRSQGILLRSRSSASANLREVGASATPIQNLSPPRQWLAIYKWLADARPASGIFDTSIAHLAC